MVVDLYVYMCICVVAGGGGYGGTQYTPCVVTMVCGVRCADVYDESW